MFYIKEKRKRYILNRYFQNLILCEYCTTKYLWQNINYSPLWNLIRSRYVCIMHLMCKILISFVTRNKVTKAFFKNKYIKYVFL